MSAIGKIKRLSINRPISVSTLISFLNKLYVAHKNATTNPTHGNDVKLKDVRKKLIIERTWNSLVYEIYHMKVIIDEKKISQIEKKIKSTKVKKS